MRCPLGQRSGAGTLACRVGTRADTGYCAMNDLVRILRYVRPYLLPLFGSVILMAGVGLAQALMALLIGPIFDRVLKPDTPDAPVVLFTIPALDRAVYLHNIVP